MGCRSLWRWVALAVILTCGGFYWLGWKKGQLDALEMAYKVYKQQIWNEHPAVIRDEKNWEGGLR
jgi:hypothetical protein